MSEWYEAPCLTSEIGRNWDHSDYGFNKIIYLEIVRILPNKTMSRLMWSLQSSTLIFFSHRFVTASTPTYTPPADTFGSVTIAGQPGGGGCDYIGVPCPYGIRENQRWGPKVWL
jgi:hypothetical protein